MKRVIINLLATIVLGFIIYYLTIPALNLSNPGFYSFLFTILIFYGVLDFASKNMTITDIGNIKFGFNPIVLVPICLVLILVVDIFSLPLFNSKAYANRISIDETGNFNEDIEEVDFSKTPLLDRDSSEKLGDRVMGTMSEFVSQFYVDDLYTQINYKNEIVRVTPLEYADIIKYISNHKEGIKGYIKVNSVNGESEVVKLKKGLKYLPSAILNDDLLRHVRFAYPTEIFGDYSFEIDEEGNPYFIIPTIKYSLVGLRKDIDGAIIVNPITGETNKYDTNNIPTWVDHVYDPNLIISQVDNWGTYQSGFLNSIFAQKDVVATTDGYNYLAYNDDIYLYTGITSVQSDESNLGFILTNLRTKETKFYSVSGAEEYSAMASSEGQVQEMEYTSTFPLLINLNGRATYLMSLKDDAGLVKKYAFVDVADYQKVVVSDVSLGIEVASKTYLSSFNFKNETAELKTKKIKVSSIKTGVIEGNTTYYITDLEGNKYSSSISVSEKILPFLQVGDEITISYVEGDLNTIRIVE